MQIKKVRIQNYQSFSDSDDQSITKLFALIGKNNSGKSAFINAIRSVIGDGDKPVSCIVYSNKQINQALSTCNDLLNHVYYCQVR